MYNFDEIEERLRTELQDARRRFESATSEFGAVTKSVPSEIPFPDNLARLKTAGAEQHAATQALREALRRWNDLIIDRKLPEDAERRVNYDPQEPASQA